jgi:hypothetical protein
MNDWHWKNESRPRRKTRKSPRRSEWRPSDNEETNRVVKCQEMSDGRRRWADAGVYIKPLSKTEEKTTSGEGVRRAGNRNSGHCRERQTEKIRK